MGGCGTAFWEPWEVRLRTATPCLPPWVWAASPGHLGDMGSEVIPKCQRYPSVRKGKGETECLIGNREIITNKGIFVHMHTDTSRHLPLQVTNHFLMKTFIGSQFTIIHDLNRKTQCLIYPNLSLKLLKC